MDKQYLTEDLPETKSKPQVATGTEKVVMTVERVGKQIKVTGTVDTEEVTDEEAKVEDKSGKQLLVE
jgi:hypothetical protein